MNFELFSLMLIFFVIHISLNDCCRSLLFYITDHESYVYGDTTILFLTEATRNSGLCHALTVELITSDLLAADLLAMSRRKYLIRWSSVHGRLPTTAFIFAFTGRAIVDDIYIDGYDLQ